MAYTVIAKGFWLPCLVVVPGMLALSFVNMWWSWISSVLGDAGTSPLMYGHMLNELGGAGPSAGAAPPRPARAEIVAYLHPLMRTHTCVCVHACVGVCVRWDLPI